MVRSALAGLDLPMMRGAAVLGAAPDAPMRAILPFRDRHAAVASALGCALPGPGESLRLPDGGLLLWAGLNQWLLRGAAAADAALVERLEDDAAAVDVSDAWAGLVLSGAGTGDVLARLVPLDLDAAAFLPGSVAASLLRHVPCRLVMGDGDVLLLVPRSLVGSAVADIARAMDGVAARACRRD